MNGVYFFVPARPSSTQTAAVIEHKGRRFPVRYGAAWTKACRIYGNQYRRLFPGFVAVEAVLRFERADFEQDGKAYSRPFPLDVPDMDNAMKKPLDEWQGLFYRTDKWIESLTIRKRWADQRGPGVEVKIWPTTV